MRHLLAYSGIVGIAVVFGCAPPAGDREGSPAEPEASVVVFNITSGATEDVHAVTMALQLAGHALDDGREAILFFNVRGVRVPTHQLRADLAFHAKPVKELLTELIARGAEVHVCPHCMKALEVTEEELIPGALVTGRQKLFSKLGSNTVVFSY